MDAASLIDLISATGREARSYGGRGMRGRRCVAIELEGVGDLFGLGADLARAADAAAGQGGGATRQPSPSVESLGLGVVAYWEDMVWPDEEEDDS